MSPVALPPGTIVEIRGPQSPGVHHPIERAVIIHSAMTWVVAYFPGDAGRLADPADPASIRVLSTGDVLAYRKFADCEPSWVIATWNHLTQSGPGLLQAPQAVLVWQHAAVLAAHQLETKATSVITRQQLESWAGRALTDQDLDRITEALPYSFVPEGIATIVGGLDRRDAKPAADLRGSMADGYDSDRVNRILGRVGKASGLRIVCVWDYHDAIGVGGDSDFYVIVDGRFHHCAGDLWRWLNTSPDDPDAPAVPGPPATWVGAPAEFGVSRLRYHDGAHNHAIHEDIDGSGAAE